MRHLGPLLLLIALSACIHPRVVEDNKLNAAGLGKVADETARLRQLPYLREIPSYAVKGKDLGRFIAGELEETSAHLDAETALYQRLAVLDPDTTMRDMYEGMYRGGTAVAGFYTWSEGGQLYVLEDYSLGVKLQLDMIGWITGDDWAYELALSHELIHALQDQHLDLARLMPPQMEMHDGDRAWAARSVIESEANFWGWAHFHAIPTEGWLARRMHAAYVAFNYAPFHLLPQLAFPRVPTFFTRLSLGNYTRGMGWVIARLDEGGRARLDEALRSEMPQSTEQLLFPDEADAPIPLPRLEVDEGEVLISDCFGALRLQTLLAPYLLPGAARDLARAWGGDRVEVVRDGERQLLLWRFILDDEAGARGLERAWRSFVSARYGGRATPTREDEGERRWSIAPGDGEVRTTLPEAVGLRRQGRAVLIVEGAAPGAVDAQLERLAAALTPAAPVVYAAESLPAEQLKDAPDGVVAPTRGALPPPRTQLLVDETGASRRVREQLHLPKRTMAWRLGMVWAPDVRPEPLLDLGEFRWGIRDGLELSLPLALSFQSDHPLGDVIVTAGVNGFSLDHFSGVLGLTHTLRLGEVAAVGQLLTTGTLRGELDESEAIARLALGGVVAPSPDLVLAAGAAWLAPVDVDRHLAGEPVRARVLEVGSALRRGGRFRQPLVEWRALDIAHLYLDGSLSLDLETGLLVDKRLGGGLLLYF